MLGSFYYYVTNLGSGPTHFTGTHYYFPSKLSLPSVADEMLLGLLKEIC
jgi:hypothetical protein